MFPNYLSWVFLLSFCLLSSILYLFGGSYQNIFISTCLLVFILLLMLFRKSSFLEKMYLGMEGNAEDLDDAEENTRTFYSPLAGKVLKIEKLDYHEFFGEKLICLTLKLGFGQEMGIYNPVLSEVIEKQKGKAQIDCLFKTSKNIFYGLSFQHFSLFSNPDLWVENGDHVQSRARIGCLSLMGSVKLYLPDHLPLAIKASDKVNLNQCLWNKI